MHYDILNAHVVTKQQCLGIPLDTPSSHRYTTQSQISVPTTMRIRFIL